MDSQTFVTKFYEEVLDLHPAWKVTGVSKGKEEKEVIITIGHL
jgi:hypothetical protein